MNITAIFVPFLTTLKPTPAQLQPLKSLALFHCVSSSGRGDSSPGSCLSRSLSSAADALAGVTPLRSPALMTGDLQPFTGRKGRPGPASSSRGASVRSRRPAERRGVEGGGAFVTWPTQKKQNIVFRWAPGFMTGDQSSKKQDSQQLPKPEMSSVLNGVRMHSVNECLKKNTNHRETFSSWELLVCYQHSCLQVW